MPSKALKANEVMRAFAAQAGAQNLVCAGLLFHDCVKLWRGLEANPEFSAPAQPPREMVREHLLHLDASHYGQKEYGAPVTPRTSEAWMLHYIDNIDAHWRCLT